MDNKFDVLVIGAGAAGLMAAWEIARTGRSVALIEAKDRTGGRMYSITDPAFSSPVELGAEFVHGNLQLTQELLQKAGAATYRVTGSIWQKKEGHLQKQEDFIEDFSDLQKKLKELHQDLPVSTFIRQYLQDDRYEALRFTLQNYVEGYYAADPDKASTYALYEEVTQSDDEQYRIVGGYYQLTHYLEEQCMAAGVAIFLSHPVWQLHWQKGAAEAITGNGRFKGSKVLITVSVGVLQTDLITFFPALPQKKEAARKLGYGHVVKIIAQFEKPFWEDPALTNGKNLEDLGFLFSKEVIPTWWTQYPNKENILTGWLAGLDAQRLSMLSNDELKQKALFALSHLFNIDVLHLDQMLQGFQLHNWSADPYFAGAYSYEVVDGAPHMKILQQPEEDTLFFCGEGLHHGPEMGTVEAALRNGKETAHNLMASFSR